MSRKLDVVTLGGEEYDDLLCDAERYRYLRRKVAIVGAQFLVMNLPSPVYVAPNAAIEFDAALDAERDARGSERQPTPSGWSDTDWIKHIQEK